MPPEGYYERRNQSLYEFYIKKLAIKTAITEQRKQIFEHYITKSITFTICNN